MQATTRKKDVLGFSGIVYEGDKEVSVDAAAVAVKFLAKVVQ